MAIEIPGFKPGQFVAGADLSALQFRFVKINSSGLVVAITGASDVPIGILQDKPAASGRSAEIMCDGISKLVAGEAMAPGNTVGPDATGKGDDSAPTGVYGQVIEGTAAADEIGSVLFSCLKPHA
jgi:hypothetical protein